MPQTKKKPAQKPVKKPAKAPAKKVAAKPVKKAPANKVKRKLNPARMKPIQPDAVLGVIIGTKPLPRSAMTKKLWDYIKKNNLQDAKKRTLINADPALKAVFGGKKHVSMFEGALPDLAGNSSCLRTWQAEVGSPAFASASGNIPIAAASQVRVYQRCFYLSK